MPLLWGRMPNSILDNSAGLQNTIITMQQCCIYYYAVIYTQSEGCIINYHVHQTLITGRVEAKLVESMQGIEMEVAGSQINGCCIS